MVSGDVAELEWAEAESETDSAALTVWEDETDRVRELDLDSDAVLLELGDSDCETVGDSVDETVEEIVRDPVAMIVGEFEVVNDVDTVSRSPVIESSSDFVTSLVFERDDSNVDDGDVECVRETEGDDDRVREEEME